MARQDRLSEIGKNQKPLSDLGNGTSGSSASWREVRIEHDLLKSDLLCKGVVVKYGQME